MTALEADTTQHTRIKPGSIYFRTYIISKQSLMTVQNQTILQAYAKNRKKK